MGTLNTAQSINQSTPDLSLAAFYGHLKGISWMVSILQANGARGKGLNGVIHCSKV